MEDRIESSKFTFKTNDGGTPYVVIDDKRVSVVTLTYNWTTSTDTDSGTNVVIVAGYINGQDELRLFRLDFKTNKATEI